MKNFINLLGIDLKNLLGIKSKRLRAQLVTHLVGLSDGAVFQRLEAIDAGAESLKDLLDVDVKDKAAQASIQAKVRGFFAGKGIRHVRLIERIELKPIRDKQRAVYKGFKPDGNAYLDVFESATGPQWEGTLVTIFDANARIIQGEPEKRRRVIRLFNRDMLEMEHQGNRRIFYIQKMSERVIALTEHFEANADSRNRSENDPFMFVYKGNAELLRRAKVRFLVVTPAGKIRYLSDDPDDSAGH